jgi:hypothetical protein
MNSWWRSDLNPDGLSQGDIIKQSPIAFSPVPEVLLIKATGKGGLETWQQGISKSKPQHFLYDGDFFPSIVLSYSCELDKKEKKGRVIVAPIRLIGNLEEKVRTDVLSQKRRALMPLPDVPELGTYYADFRMMSVINRKGMDENRLASMTESGVMRLQAQLVAFFTRLDVTALQGQESGR